MTQAVCDRASQPTIALLRWVGTSALIGGFVLSPGGAAGQSDAGDLRALFTHTARIEPGAAGESVASGSMVRLQLTPEVLAVAAPDLADLRLLANETQVPFVIDGRRRQVELATRYPARLLAFENRRTEPGTGEGPDAARNVETMVIESPPPGDDDGWLLVARVDTRRFARTVRVFARAEPGAGVEESVADRQIGSGSLFRLQDPIRESLSLAVSDPGAADVRIRLEGPGEELAPSWFWERRAPLADPASTRRIPLRRLPGTEARFQRPAALLPEALVLRSDTALVRSLFRLWDVQLDGTRSLLAEGTLFRAGEIGEETIVPLHHRTPRGAELELELESGEIPFSLELEAVVRPPSVLFPWPQAADSLELLVGGNRARAPSGGLAELSQRLQRDPAGALGDQFGGAEAEVTALLIEELPSAELRELRRNPRFEDRPQLEPLLRPGSEVDPSRFSHRRLLTIVNSPDGLSELSLGPGDLSVLRDDLGDLRLIDESRRQWPYRIWRDDEEPRPPIEPRVENSDATTTYALDSPWSPLPTVGVELRTDQPFFDRPARVVGRRGGEEVALVDTRLQRLVSGGAPITLRWPRSRATSLALVVENGDDAPIEFTGVRLLVPQPTLQIIAPGGDYELLLGEPELEAPTYEALRARLLLLQNLRAGEASAAALEDNPAYQPTRRLVGALSRPESWIWLAVVFAVVGLAALTLRTLAGAGPRLEE